MYQGLEVVAVQLTDTRLVNWYDAAEDEKYQAHNDFSTRSPESAVILNFPITVRQATFILI